MTSPFTQKSTHIPILLSNSQKMPKIVKRCRRPHNNHAVSTMSSSMLMSDTPRIVSFEDNFPGCPPSSTELDSEEQTLLQKASITIPLRLSLARRKSSISLVELAAQSIYKAPATSASAPVSPLSSPLLEPLPSSPWGHFVDMHVPEEDYERNTSYSPQVSHELSCRCCFSCRRKQLQPYGEYRRSLKESPKSFLLDNSVSSSFRLARRPQAEQTEQLIVALDGLQVD